MSSTPDMLSLLEESRLLTAADLSALRSQVQDTQDASQILQTLVEAQSVTRWQARELLEGKSDFTLDGGRYVLLELLGQGGMGAVYKARQVRMNRIVALKLIDPRKAVDASLVARFHREVEIAARLQHEHIVQAYDVGEHQGTIFLVMEYVAGCELAAVVKREGPFAPDEACAIAAQAAAGLAYAHAQGIVHRDIKPQNILLSDQGVAKVLDLGLARIETAEGDEHTALTREGTVMGTIDYMAPEHARDTHHADSRSDIYSLGATLYYLLAGRPPFAGGSAAEKLLRLSTEDPTPLGQLHPDLPRSLIEVVERSLTKRPVDRFQTMEDFVRALQPFAASAVQGRPGVTAAVQSAAAQFRQFDTLPTSGSSLPFVPADEPATRLLKRPAKSSRTPWIAGGVAAVLLAAGMVAAILGRSSPPGEESSPDVAASAAPGLLPPAAIREEMSTSFFGTVNDAAWSPDLRYVALACSDGDVRVFNVGSRECEVLYDGHASAVSSVAWSPDGKRIVSRERSPPRLHVWEVASRKRQLELELNQSSGDNSPLGWSAKGDRLVYPARSELYFHDLAANQSMRVPFPGSAASPYRFGQAPFRMRTSPAADAAVLIGGDGSLLVVSAVSGRLTYELWGATAGSASRDAVFLSDGTVLMAEPGRIWALDPHSGEEVELTVAWPPQLRLPGDQVRQLRFDDAGRRLLCVPTNLRDGEQLIDLAGGTTTQRPGCFNQHPNLRVDSPTLHAALGAGNVIAVGESGRTTRLATCFNLGRGGIPAAWELEQLVGRRYLGLKQNDRRLYIDLHTGQAVSTLPRHAHLRSDGALDVLVGGRILRYPSVDEVAAGRFSVVSSLAEATNLAAAQVCWSEDGERLAVYDHRQLAFHGWDAATGRRLFTADLKLHGSNHSPDQVVIDCSADGRTVLLAVHQKGHWLARENGGTWTVTEGEGRSQIVAALQPDGAAAITVEPLAYPQARLRIWPADPTAAVRDQPIQYQSDGWRGHVRLPVAPSGKFIAINCSVLDTATGAVQWTLSQRRPTRGQHCDEWPVFLSDDRLLVNVHNRYQVWNWPENRLEFELLLLPEAQWACIGAGGDYVASPLADNYLRLLYRPAEGREQWLSPAEYTRRTGWKSNPDQARLAAVPSTGR